MNLSDVLNLLRNPRFIIKLSQLVIAIICAATADSSVFAAKNIHKAALLHTVYCGYIIIASMELSRIIIGDRTRQIMELFWAAVAIILWVAAAAVDLEYYVAAAQLYPNSNEYLKEKLTSGLLGILNAIVYIAELGFVFKWG